MRRSAVRILSLRHARNVLDGADPHVASPYEATRIDLRLVSSANLRVDATLAVGAAAYHAADFTRDGARLVCRHCGASIEPSLSQTHLRSPRCEAARR